MANSASAAQAAALAAVGSKIPSGYCLKYVRTWLGIGAKYATAASAKSNVNKFHTDQPAIGLVVPVWFNSKNPAGHVALRLADGTVVTVNGTKVSRFASVAAVAAVFGTYLGWGEDLNEVGVDLTNLAPKPVQTTPPPAASTGNILYVGLYNNAAVGRFQAGMRKIFPAYKNEVDVKRGQLITVDNDYGPQSAAWTAVFQRKVGLVPTGNVDQATRTKLAAYGVTF